MTMTIVIRVAASISEGFLCAKHWTMHYVLYELSTFHE